MHSLKIPTAARPDRPESRATPESAQLKCAFEGWLPPYNGHVGRRSCCLVALHSRCVYDTDNSLTTGVDMDMLNPDLLLTLAAIPLQALYLQSESPQYLDC